MTNRRAARACWIHRAGKVRWELVVAAVAMVATIAVVGFVCIGRHDRGPRPALPKKFTDAELRQLLADKNHAIALLENNKLAEADAAFAELAKQAKTALENKPQARAAA